ncbi:complement C1q subcomponent subunit B-like [Mytilus californianus]|uniref:complement C1q subcomponent subunit B-like n=1 Tax=Mytilus californianus TaxID=6549 RepID=UPI0022484A60|nr:complement C1q subcomponent subunit B-like [Mytilus californianus]
MRALCFIVVALVMSCFGHKTDSGLCTPKLENALFEDLLSMMLKIKGTQKGTNQHDETFSAFAASLTVLKTLGTGEIVKFDKVWTNVNNDYNPSTGVYTAPKPGVYQFSCSVMTQYNKAVRVLLWKNDMKTVAVYPGPNNVGHNTGTINMVLELKKGDKEYIKQGAAEKYIYSESAYNYSMFSGYLIR